MHSHQHGKRPGLLKSVLRNKCPRCREGALFTSKNPYQLRKITDMPEHCPVCGQSFEPEIGFYYGTGYVSYGLSVAATVASLLIWIATIGISLYDNRIFWWLGIHIALMILIQPVLMRWSRSIWIAFFVRYDNSRTEKAGEMKMAGKQAI
jgi:uncharacterized protein (DUF983 family)